jgi:hypothetical protein
VSYDLELVDPVSGETLELDTPHQMHGGTYAVGGTKELRFNITYNYGIYYYEHMDTERGLRALYGMTGAESIPLLKATIDKLGTDVNPDYWAKTEGNARKALCSLLALAQLRPDGVWAGD